MQELQRATSYFVLQLIGAGFYCLEPRHTDAAVVIAGKDGQGLAVLFEWSDTAPDRAPTAAASLPSELSFLKLPVFVVRVSPDDTAKAGRPLLIATTDEALVQLLAIDKPGQFGIRVQAWPQTT